MKVSCTLPNFLIGTDPTESSMLPEKDNVTVTTPSTEMEEGFVSSPEFKYELFSLLKQFLLTLLRLLNLY